MAGKYAGISGKGELVGKYIRGLSRSLALIRSWTMMGDASEQIYSFVVSHYKKSLYYSKILSDVAEQKKYLGSNDVRTGI